MKRKHLAAFLVLLAAGCSQTTAPDAGPSVETPDLQVSIPFEQTEDSNLSVVTLNVTGMT